MKIGTWLLGLVQPWVAKVLLALGFNVVTITGMNVAFDTIKQRFVGGVNALPVDVLNLFLLAGGGTGLGIILGAFATKLALWQIQNSVKILGTNQQ